MKSTRGGIKSRLEDAEEKNISSLSGGQGNSRIAKGKFLKNKDRLRDLYHNIK